MTHAQFAIVKSPLAPMQEEPIVSAAQLNQALHGHPLDVLDTREEWRRVRGDDDYEGWVHNGYLRILDPHDFTAGSSEDETMISLGCIARSRTSGRRALPLGAYLLAEEEIIESGEALLLGDCERRFTPDAESICKTALTRFEGTTYEWGGVTPWGADCSGLVQSSFRLHGVELPRDAKMQAEKGTELQLEMTALEPADLLFFSDRTDKYVTHVGIAVGDGKMVHLSLGRGGYGVEKLGDTQDPYVRLLRDRFLFARRVL